MTQGTKTKKTVTANQSTTACRVIANRLRDACRLPENKNLWRAGRGFVVRDLSWTLDKLRAIPHFEFENWAVIALGGIPNKAQADTKHESAAPHKETGRTIKLITVQEILDDWHVQKT